MRNHLPGTLCRGYRRREEAQVQAEKEKAKELQREAEEKMVAGGTDGSVKKEGVKKEETAETPVKREGAAASSGGYNIVAASVGGAFL